ncbi:Eukaryotic initiation factor 4A-III [Linnemannia zychae]|nr:Eukaryotic initiation factor 4A-III [Linnemannia zychae]
MSESTASAPPAAATTSSSSGTAAPSAPPPTAAAAAAPTATTHTPPPATKKRDEDNAQESTTKSSSKPKSNVPAAGSLPGSPKSGRSKKSNNTAGASRGQENGAARSSSGTAAVGHINGNNNNNNNNSINSNNSSNNNKESLSAGGVGLGVSSSSSSAGGSSSNHHKGAVGATAGSSDKERATSSSQHNHQNSSSHHNSQKGGRWEGSGGGSGGGGGGGGGPNNNNGMGNNNAPYHQQHRSNNNSAHTLASASEARFANSRPVGGGGNYRGGGGGGEEDFVGRGRKFEKRAPRPHQGPSTEQPATGTTQSRSQRLESPGVSEAKKSQNATRSPRSPRSPRRGFGERGLSSTVGAGAGGQDKLMTTTTTTITVTTVPENLGDKDEADAGGSQAGPGAAGSAKKRKAGRKTNKKRDDDEGSTVSHGSTREGDSSSLDVKESSSVGGKGDSLPSAAKEDSQEGSGGSTSTWMPKSKSNRPHQFDNSSGHNNNNTRPPFKHSGPRDNNGYNRNDSSSGPSYTSRNSYLGQRNGPDGRRPHHSDRGPRDTADSSDWNSGKSRSAPSVNKDGSRPQYQQNGLGDLPAATTPGGGKGDDTSNWMSTSSAAQKDALQAQDGWGASPAPTSTQSSGWGATPTSTAPTPAATASTTQPQSGGWDKAQAKKDEPSKAPGTNDGWGKAPETNDSWDHAAAGNGGWGENPEKTDSWNRNTTKREKWGNDPSKSEGWNKSSAKGQGRGRSEAPATHHTSKRGEAPSTAATTTTQHGGLNQQSPVKNDKRREDSPAKAPNGGGKKEIPVPAAAATGWGEPPLVKVQDAGWDAGQPVNSSAKWGESVPWETNDAPAAVVKSGWGDAPETSNKQDSTTSNDDQKRTGAGRGKSLGSSDARFAASQQGYQRGGRPFQDNRGDRRFQDADSSQQSQGSPSQPPKDARSSLDARNARLGTPRGPRLYEDGKAEQRGEASENPTTRPGNKDTDQEAKRAPVGDVRLDPRSGGRQPRNSGNSAQFGQRDQSNEFFSRKSPTNRGIYDKSGPGRANGKQQNTSSKLKPMFSNSLECQMTWEEMGLKPEVYAKIAKAGLDKPSNIQKLVMKPFKEGKDVIAQTQSQKDRTNTLAIALLEKLLTKAHTHKYPQAVVICSDGVNPQRVNEDFQDWFDGTSGLGSIYLTSEDITSEESVLSDQEQSKQVIVTTLGPLMELLKKELVDMKFVETVVVSMRSDELVNFDAFKRFWAMLPREAQTVLMTGRIHQSLQAIKTQNFRPNTAVRRADELTMQWSEHFFVDIPQQTTPEVTDGESNEMDEATDHKWEVLMEILGKNPDISHIVILTQSQSQTQALTVKLEQKNLPVLSVWSMADKTEVARQFNRPDRCIFVIESLLIDSLDLDHSSLVINYEMPKRASHYISLFGPFGRSGLRTLMINFCVKEDPVQLLTLESMEAMYDIKIREMQLD